MNEIETSVSAFADMDLSEQLLDALSDMGFSEPSPIQAEAIPVILSGKDVIGQAQTGTGKTAAFGVPMIELISMENKSVSGIVLCPTRELAIQVSNELKKIAKYKKGLHILPVYGGEPIERQIAALKRGVKIVVGTPGRVIDHLNRGTLRLDKVHMVVLDEADEMLNMGFRDDIEEILKSVPDERQTILFSATMPKPILELVHRYQRNPQMVKITKAELTNDAIEQSYFEVSESSKIRLITQLIRLNDLKLMLVFCNTKRKVEEVVEQLKLNGLKVDGIHGDLRQNQRNTVLSKLRNSEINILVATDVAARGIDVSNVDAVFNYDIPLDPEYYVHRIGRTGRAGKTGKAYSFVTGRNDRKLLMEIEKFSKTTIHPGTLPTKEEWLNLCKENLKQKIQVALQARRNELYSQVFQDFLSEGLSAEEVSTALLRLILKDELDFILTIKKAHREINDEYNTEHTEKTVRLFLNVGKKDKISPKDIVGTIIKNTKINFRQIGDIDVYDTFSFVEVPKKKSEEIMELFKTLKVKGRKVNAEIAKSR
ncbi:MAG: DEAD/DEAH box helicase [Cytophagaceae bacterium]|nr:DEAD/DEAH box helicase [Cytophagaceae bacterium]MDW8457322.1 DEAD/DEAH box helicase [Cytophagaceae bacterium]